MRATLVTASLGNCIGCWFKVFSADPDKFYIGFMGQFVLSCTQLVIISTPASFAGVWFGANEVSTACALGVFGQQLGMALGFILPPLMIRNHEELDSIGKDFYRFFILNAIVTTIVLVLTVICKLKNFFSLLFFFILRFILSTAIIPQISLIGWTKLLSLLAKNLPSREKP